MKGKELIEFIQNNNLEDFDLEMSFLDGYEAGFPNYRKLEIEKVADGGYSDKVVVLVVNEK